MNRVLMVGALCMLTACAAPQKKYEWGNYEQSLYEYYKAPANAAALATSVEATIGKAEQASRPVPPGIYAEYGFLLLQQGRVQDAAVFFNKEKTHWPESATLMTRMIKLAESKSNARNEVKQ